jgi:hypothetical protein
MKSAELANLHECFMYLAAKSAEDKVKYDDANSTK